MFWMPETVEDLINTLRTKDENTHFCAGGTDLVIELREKKQFHFSLIDLTHVKELQAIEEQGDTIRIGAAVTMDELERSALVREYAPALLRAASSVGSTQIRNRATIGGNVANASQSSDLAPVLMTYKAQAVIVNSQGEKRSLSVEELVIGLGKTVLMSDEVILWFLFEKRKDFSAFSKVGSRKAVTISKLNACMRASVENGKLNSVSVYLGAVGEKAKAAPVIENALEGAELSQLPNEAVREAVYQQIEANIPDRSSRHYKKSAAFGLICDMLDEFISGREGGSDK